MKKILNFKNIINLLLISIIVLGVFTSLKMLFVNRSLWVDEAMFSYSFSQRNIFNLISSPFELDQIAPVIYLYIIKIITIIFGNSEIILRVLSFISFGGVIYLSYFLSKKLFSFKYPLAPGAYISGMLVLLRYSMEFKCYMFDSFCVLMVILFYYLYNNKKISLQWLTIICVALLLASNPTCFFIGGIFIYELLQALIKKDKRHFVHLTIASLVIVLSFILYYFLWLRNTATSAYMIDFWKNYNLKFVTSFKDFAINNNIIKEYIGRIPVFSYFIVFLFLIDIIINVIIKKKKYHTIIVFGMLLALFACLIKMFPMKDRIWLFGYPIIIILSFDLLNYLFTKDKLKNLIVISIYFLLILSNLLNNGGIRYYLKDDNVYLSGEEGNILIDYLNKNIKDDEKLYVYFSSMPLVKYKLGYNNYSIGGYDNNIIFANGFYDNDNYLDDIDIVSKQEKCYLLFTHLVIERAEKLFNNLQKNGYLELIYNPHNTPLYYYIKNPKNMQTKVEYIIKKTDYKNNKYYLNLLIKNIGNSIINNQFENVYLGSKDDENMHINIKKNFNKNTSIELNIELDFEKNDKINIQLYSEGYYWYDELGIEPIKITKDMFKNI